MDAKKHAIYTKGYLEELNIKQVEIAKYLKTDKSRISRALDHTNSFANRMQWIIDIQMAMMNIIQQRKNNGILEKGDKNLIQGIYMHQGISFLLTSTLDEFEIPEDQGSLSNAEMHLFRVIIINCFLWIIDQKDRTMLVKIVDGIKNDQVITAYFLKIFSNYCAMKSNELTVQSLYKSNINGN